MSIQTLEQIAATGQPWAAQRAQYALQMTEAVNQGELSPGEYQELMRDLVRMDRLDEEASDIELKTLLITAVYGVAQLA
jgi:hypothetical protein